MAESLLSSSQNIQRDLAVAFHLRGVLYYTEKNFQKAEGDIQQSLAIWKKANPNMMVLMAVSLLQLAKIKVELQKFQEAELIFYQVLGIYQNHFLFLEEWSTIELLIDMLKQQVRFEQSKQLCLQFISKIRFSPDFQSGPNHPFLISPMKKLSEFLEGNEKNQNEQLALYCSE